MNITASDEARVLASVPKGLLIDGVWRDSSDGSTLDVSDPATGQVIATIASATAADGMAALDAADRAQKAWAKTAPRYRAEILRKAFDRVIEMADDFAILMSIEMGKPFAEAKGEVVTPLLRLEVAADLPTPAAHMDARRALQLQMLTRRNDPSPQMTWAADASQVLSGAYDEGNARRLQAALKVLLKR